MGWIGVILGGETDPEIPSGSGVEIGPRRRLERGVEKRGQKVALRNKGF